MAGKRQKVPRFTVVPHAFGLRPGVDPDRLNQLVDELEVEELAALCIEHQAELHSTDADFARFPGLRRKNSLTPPSVRRARTRRPRDRSR